MIKFSTSIVRHDKDIILHLNFNTEETVIKLDVRSKSKVNMVNLAFLLPWQQF